MLVARDNAYRESDRGCPPKSEKSNMDNKAAIASTLNFLNKNLKCFAHEEVRTYGTIPQVTFSHQTESGEVRNGKVEAGKLSHNTTTRFVNVTFYPANNIKTNALDCSVRKLIPNTGEIKFDKKTKYRLNTVLSFIESTHVRKSEMQSRELSVREFKDSMNEKLSEIGIETNYDQHSEKINNTSTRIDVKDRVVSFTALTSDVELIRKLREVCANHT